MPARQPNRNKFPIAGKTIFKEWAEMPYWDGVRYYQVAVECHEGVPARALEAMKNSIERSLVGIIVKNLPCVVGAIEYSYQKDPKYAVPILVAGVRITPLGDTSEKEIN